ncbi:amidase family protein [Pullulanibacillus sp. KACC 23026]|uniref:amidase family protein n=1 Tax=Pullulanibacillus sp. KACC 23026 TaxID=3028315 RepID=UPI0023B11B14|nr:amidase family protein [Pullulanibacillus sp. KACC 23026]WEG11024.1 amidase family protein [Pullulanibacillus sp. KACC 23026]
MKKEQDLLQLSEFSILEASIQDLQIAMEQGLVSSEELVKFYLDRIERYDKKGPALNALVYVNPEAIETARALDQERMEKGSRGPLHGIPIILKDNYDTYDMPTTASSKTLEGSIPLRDAFLTARLREAGVVILGKSNLHEFAYGISSMSSLGGQTFNPYGLNHHPGGSSGGTGAAIAANFAVFGMGSDTGCSIRNPSSYNSLVGLRSSYGLTSRAGIIPISITQDVGGPMAKTVTDIAIVMDRLAGFEDPRDPSTKLGVDKRPDTYTAFLKRDGLKGARIGILRACFGESNETEPANRVIEQSIQELEGEGANCLDIELSQLHEAKEGDLPKYEFQTAIERYLMELGEDRPVSTLQEIVDSGLCIPGIMEALTSALGKSMEDPDYKAGLEKRLKFRESVEQAMDDSDIDAILYPTFQSPPPLIGQERWAYNNGALSAYSGLPAIAVPAGFTEDGLPVGMELCARMYQEPKLIELAYAYEQATHHRKPPVKNVP